MARIPTLQSPAQLQTGTQTLQTAQLPAVTNASIGKALGDVSSVAFDISEKAKRANDVTNLTNASLEMQKAQLEFATFQQNEPDESKWIPKWQELTTQIEGNVSKMPLTPDARAQLTERFSRWSTNGTIAVQAEGFKQAGQRMDDSFKTAVVQKNYAAAEQNIEDRVQNGFITRQQGDLEKAQLRKQALDDKYNDFLAQKEMLLGQSGGDIASIEKLEKVLDSYKDTMTPALYALERSILLDRKEKAVVAIDTKDDPRQVLLRLEEKNKSGEYSYAPNLKTPEQRDEMKRNALTRIEEIQGQEKYNAMLGIVSGSVKSYEEAETLMPQSDLLQKNAIKSIFDKKPPTQYEAQILRRALDTAIDNYDASKDDNSDKMFYIVDTINRLDMYDEKLTSHQRERFYQKANKKAPPSPMESEVANHKKFMDAVFEPKLKAMLDSKGNIPEGKMQEYRETLSYRDKLTSDFEEEVKQGTIKNRVDARNRSIELLRQPYADKTAEFWRYAPSAEEMKDVDAKFRALQLGH
jgi:hypothetical protein